MRSAVEGYRQAVSAPPPCCAWSPSPISQGRNYSPSASACAWCKASPTCTPPRSSPPAPSAPFASVEDVWRRSGVPVGGAREARRCRRLRLRSASTAARPCGRCAASASALCPCSPPPTRDRRRSRRSALTPMTDGREVVEDYRAIQLSLRAHPLAFLRPELDRLGIDPLRRSRARQGRRQVEVAGLVLIRQRPGKGNVTFITIEDETGIANIILWQRKFEAQRRIVMSRGDDRGQGHCAARGRGHPRRRRPARGP